MSSIGDERREFLRFDHEVAVNFRDVRVDKLGSRSEIFTLNLSPSGLLFRTKNLPPALSSTIWVQLNDHMMNVCSEIESDLIIREGGVMGRVVRLAEGEPGVSYDVGVCFLRRRNMSDSDVSEFLHLN
jgi:hypothetical protein